MNKHVEQLKKLIPPYIGPELIGVCDKVLEDPRFSTMPASPSKHHAWEGGLAEHTLQVVKQALVLADAAPRINKAVVVVAATWHDYGKVFDYEVSSCATWRYTLHHERVRHLPRSYAEFMIATAGMPEYCNAFKEHVCHCILAHHGSFEAGSPVLPQTREAWAVHLADMASVHCIEERK